MAWLPGATVQAAIGTTAYVRLIALKGVNQTSPEFLAKKLVASDITAVSVISILMTAPLGALLMRIFSARLLPVHRPGIVDRKEKSEPWSEPRKDATQDTDVESISNMGPCMGERVEENMLQA